MKILRDSVIFLKGMLWLTAMLIVLPVLIIYFLGGCIYQLGLGEF